MFAMLQRIIPREVIFNHILPNLGINDIHRFGKVCRETKLISQDYIKEKYVPDDTHEAVLDNSNDTVSKFLKHGVPSSSIYINNKTFGSKFFENESLREFLKVYGSRIKHVRIRQLSCIMTKNEASFYGYLENLETLEIENVAFGSIDEKVFIKLVKSENDDFRVLSDKFFDSYVKSSFPKRILNQLKILKFTFSEEDFTLKSFVFSLVLPQYLKKLELLRNTFWGNETTIGNGLCLERLFNKLIYVCFPLLPNLKFYDLTCLFQISIEIVRQSAIIINNFLSACIEREIWLLNLNSVFIEAINPFQNQGTNIVSLQNIHTFVQMMNMTKLEKINAKTSSSSCNCKLIRPGYNSFVNLRIIELTIDSVCMQNTRWFDNGTIYNTTETHFTDDLITFLFRNCIREKLDVLSFVYVDIIKDIALFEPKKVKIPMPKILELCTSCPNITKLTLCGWPGTNKGILNLWTGFDHLTDVCFDQCVNLGNAAFVGESVLNPCCLKLKGLKRLALKRLDKMPKITNTLFETTIKHMSLTHFVITSDSEILKQQITPEGVLALKSGNFAQTIEYFPFQEWSMEDISPTQFKKLGSNFRSFYYQTILKQSKESNSNQKIMDVALADVFCLIVNYVPAKDRILLKRTCRRINDILQDEEETWLFEEVMPLVWKHLRKKDILVARRVCRTWKFAIDYYADNFAVPYLRSTTSILQLQKTGLVVPIEFLWESFYLSFNRGRVIKMFCESMDKNANPFFGSAIKIGLTRFGRNEKETGYYSMVEKLLDLFGQHVKHLNVCLQLDDYETYEYFVTWLQKVPNIESLKITGWSQEGAYTQPVNKRLFYMRLPSLVFLRVLDVSDSKIHNDFGTILVYKYHLNLATLCIPLDMLSCVPVSIMNGSHLTEVVFYNVTSCIRLLKTFKSHLNCSLNTLQKVVINLDLRLDMNDVFELLHELRVSIVELRNPSKYLFGLLTAFDFKDFNHMEHLTSLTISDSVELSFKFLGLLKSLRHLCLLPIWSYDDDIPLENQMYRRVRCSLDEAIYRCLYLKGLPTKIIWQTLPNLQVFSVARQIEFNIHLRQFFRSTYKALPDKYFLKPSRCLLRQ